MGINDIIRIIKNVINNVRSASDEVSQAAQTPTGEKIVTVISIIVVSFLVLIVAVLTGMAFCALISSLNAEAGSCAAMCAGIIIFAANSSQNIGWFAVLVTILTALLGFALAGERIFLMFGNSEKSAKKRMQKPLPLMCSAFITAVFVVSPKMYNILPLKVNKWCLYITVVVLLFNAADEAIKAIFDGTEPDDDII